MTNIGNNIRQARIAAQMTQEELASKMGYKSKSTINKIELGKNDIPQSKIKQFAEVLGTTTAILMGWEEMQKNNDIIADIVIRLRTDTDFLDVVSNMYKLNDEQLASVKQMLSAFLK